MMVLTGSGMGLGVYNMEQLDPDKFMGRLTRTVFPGR
jgi:saccharopine dehydrogenase-like NADP-dependent oxidoreductase